MRGPGRTSAQALVGWCVLIILASGCAQPTAEDRRRAKLIGRDPIFDIALPDVHFVWSRAVAVPGNGGGAQTTWTDALRPGTVDGDPRRSLLQAGEEAVRLGWVIGSPSCLNAGTYIVGGWKQFDPLRSLPKHQRR